MSTLAFFWTESNYLLDEHEVEEYRSRGMLTPLQLKIIDETKHFVLNNYREILAEIAHAS